MRVRIVVLALAVGLVGGCSKQSPEQFYAAAEQLAAEPAKRLEARAQFDEFLSRYAGHPLTPQVLKQLAMLDQQDGKIDLAISRYEQLLRRFPQSDQADEAQFMIAFISEEYLKDFDRARQAYQAVIDKYPNSELAASARRLLPNVGRDPEEWVEFEDVSQAAGTR
jgi:outer membrane protein assembly factor BamD (BamD/ComL family)